MSAHDLLVAHLNALLLAVVAAGLVVHRRYRLCRFFLAYVLAAFIGNRLIVTWPETFFAASFWSTKEAVYSALKVGIAAELGLLTFLRFPRARRLFMVALAVVAVAGALFQLAPGLLRDYASGLTVANARAQLAVIWLLLTTVLMAFYYRVPLHPFHRGLLVGFALYLGTNAAAWSLYWSDAYPYFAALDQASYSGTVAIWALAAWRPVPVPSRGLRALQPWAEAAS